MSEHQHGGEHQHGPGAARQPAITRDSYDELYRSAPAVWTGKPNGQLVREASDLPPGRALDAGAGEGGDALWLASRGWRVTAVDFSPVALGRGAAKAAELLLTDRIEWRHEDLEAWAPPEASFDLVTAHYLHSAWADREAMFRRLAAAVAPGGTLLVVGHQHGEQWGHGHAHAHEAGALYAADDVAAVLDPEQWTDVVTETRDRDPDAAHRTGNPVPDTVLVARRR